MFGSFRWVGRFLNTLSERTKTRPETTRTLTVVWGTNALPGRTARAVSWYRALLEAEGAATTLVTPRPAPSGWAG